MLSTQEFIRISLEINLFFQRIMKEHLFFIQTNLQPVETAYIKEANVLKQGFEHLLADTILCVNGALSENVIKSNELVTPYTLRAEELNMMLTGASLNTEITKAEYELINSNRNQECSENEVYELNRKSYSLLKQVISFQKKLLTMVSECKIFITLYDEMLEHDTREAEYYLEILESLLNRTLPSKTLCEELNFWNNIMGEHAEFIDGLLDPTEKSLKDTAKTFALQFEKLVKECIRTAEKQIIENSLESTQGIRGFKRTATEGLLNCRIKSIIPPLLADHVLREANHYLRLLLIKR